MTPKMQARAKLVEYIQRWMDAGKNRSVQQLSNESDVSYSTIRKILEGETYPDPTNALALLLVVATDEEIEKYVDEFQPVTKALLQRLRKDAERNISLSQRFHDPHIYWITAQAYGEICTRETVKEQLGEMGLAVLDSLVAEKALILSDGKYKPNRDKGDLLVLSHESVRHSMFHGIDESMKHREANRGSATFNVTEKCAAEIISDSCQWFDDATMKAKAEEGTTLISFLICATPVVKGKE